LVLAFLIVGAVALSCARKPPEPSLRELYKRRGEPLEGVDLSGLKGRRIVIDPGHGGVFPGAVGVGGLKESDVNLGVALYLWGLLDEAGADVTLTRSSDRDFVGGDSLRVRDDLKARVEIAKEIDPDVFISLHHNAEPYGDSTFNQIQIYHKFEDSGPSLDIARMMAKHLLINIGEPDCKVHPGNYYVLRNSPCPSVLCEPSYLSNPIVENKLKLAEKQRLEAESYFLALVDYFSRGVPGIDAFGPQGEPGESRPGIEAVFSAGIAVDASTVRIALDGEDLHVYSPEPGRFIAFPAGHLKSGWHTATASGRSIGGNASREARVPFRVSLKPAIVKLTRKPGNPNPPYPQRVSAIVRDVNGNPVADSTVVEFIWDGGKAERLTAGGRASVFVGRDLGFDRTYIAAVCEEVPGDLKLTDRTGSNTISGFVTDADGKPIEGAVVSEPESGESAATDEHGFFAISADVHVTGLEIAARGYRKTYYWVKGDEEPVAELKRVYSSLPAATVVTIDPAGGGEEPGWVGPAGDKASDINLAVASKLSHLLAGAGIDARLTRRDDVRMTPEERVRANEAAGSDLFITISHSPGADMAARIGHYHNSQRGIELAGLVKAYFETSVGDPATVAATANYLVQQTSCPAVRVVYTAPDNLMGSGGLAEAAAVWRRAYALFLAVLTFRGVDAEATFSLEGRVSSGGEPAPNALVVVDGALEVMTDESGAFALKLLEKTDHTVQAYSTAGKSAPAVFNEETAFLEIELE
jgi:N-acetylmuramoyl-L-alanine amidase